MQAILVAFAIVAGVLNTIQTGANTALDKGLGVPAWTAAVVGLATFLTGLLAAVAVTVVTGQRPTLEAISHMPWGDGREEPLEPSTCSRPCLPRTRSERRS